MLALEGMMNAQRNRGMCLRVGERPAEIRKSRKISQAKLAKLLGLVEPKMRFVSTALVMMTIALMLLALMLLTPTVRANPSLAPTLVIVKP
jgi:transcriptional regulator with XRE-family HTH domain